MRRLTPADRSALVAYLERDRANNLFHLSNMEQLGFEHPDLRYYGVFAGDEWRGELMLIRSNAGVVWDAPEAIPCLVERLIQEGAGLISGRRDLVEPLLDYLPAGRLDHVVLTHYATVTAPGLRPWPACGERLATLADVEALSDLYAENALHRSAPTHSEQRRRVEQTLTTGGLITLVERDGRVVSAARTSAVGAGMAMIGAVFTLPAYRRRGFARACTGLLSRALLDQSLEPYLNYDPLDPGASRAYRTLGYEDIGEWMLAFLRPA